MDLRIRFVLEPSENIEPLPVECQRALDQIVIGGSEQPGKVLPERRADAGVQSRGIGRRFAQPRERVDDAAGDARIVVGQRAVEIEEQGVDRLHANYPGSSAH